MESWVSLALLASTLSGLIAVGLALLVTPERVLRLQPAASAAASK